MTKKHIAIYGAGYAGLHLLDEYSNTENVKIICFVDDNIKLQSKKIRNVEILNSEDFKLNLNRLKIDELIISIPSASSVVIKRIYNSFFKIIPSIKILPSLQSILYNKPFRNQVKDINVELLLNRNIKVFDSSEVVKMITGNVVMITGGGGSIGSELTKQCFKYGAKKIIIVDNSEFNLYSVCEHYASDPNVIPCMINVTDKVLLDEVFSNFKPSIVIHAAAYKHVSMIEKNKISGVINNIIGTKNCIDLSIRYNVKKFILISTDKAVRPTNVMGATKRICELYAQNVPSFKTEIVAVRFGNVLDSSGSVIPKFKKQISLGGPVTVTHPEITRYFMLIPEACELVLQSGCLGKGGEVFILNMGEPVKIVDLANRLIKLSNDDNLKIEFSGLQPGEKLFEELLIDDSKLSTSNEDITIAYPSKYDIDLLNTQINKLLGSENDNSILINLKVIVKEFNHKKN